MRTSGKPVKKWRCPPCKGRGFLNLYSFESQERSTCGRCEGRGWIFSQPFWPWNWKTFRLPSQRTPEHDRKFLHRERNTLEEHFEKIGA
jgi:predicted methyltransferase